MSDNEFVKVARRRSKTKVANSSGDWGVKADEGQGSGGAGPSRASTPGEKGEDSSDLSDFSINDGSLNFLYQSWDLEALAAGPGVSPLRPAKKINKLSVHSPPAREP